jgi:hypothetical protein
MRQSTGGWSVVGSPVNAGRCCSAIRSSCLLRSSSIILFKQKGFFEISFNMFYRSYLNGQLKFELVLIFIILNGLSWSLVDRIKNLTSAIVPSFTVTPIINKFISLYFLLKIWSPNVGLEPTTLRLRVSCSTDWASRAVVMKNALLIVSNLHLKPNNFLLMNTIKLKFQEMFYLIFLASFDSPTTLTWSRVLRWLAEIEFDGKSL